MKFKELAIGDRFRIPNLLSYIFEKVNNDFGTDDNNAKYINTTYAGIHSRFTEEYEIDKITTKLDNMTEMATLVPGIYNVESLEWLNKKGFKIEVITPVKVYMEKVLTFGDLNDGEDFYENGGVIRYRKIAPWGQIKGKNINTIYQLDYLQIFGRNFDDNTEVKRVCSGQS